MKSLKLSKILLIIFIVNITYQNKSPEELKAEFDAFQIIILNMIKGHMKNFFDPQFVLDISDESKNEIEIGTETVRLEVEEPKDFENNKTLKITFTTKQEGKKNRSCVETNFEIQLFKSIETRPHVISFIEKVVNNFCMKVTQNIFELELMNDDIVKLFNEAFKDPSKGDTFEPDPSMVDFSIFYGVGREGYKEYRPVYFFIKKDDDSTPEMLKYTIDLSNPKYDQVYMTVSKETDEVNGDKITISINSNYFSFEYVMTFITKRFLLKMIEGAFLKIRNQIFKNLDELDRRLSSSNFQSNLSNYIVAAGNGLFVDDVTIKQAEQYKSCEFDFSFDITDNYAQINFSYEPKTILTAVNNTKTIITKKFPLNSLYNIYTFPVLFIQNIINMLTVITRIDQGGESTQSGMINPFIEYVEEIDGEYYLVSNLNKTPGDTYEPEFTVIEKKYPPEYEGGEERIVKIVDYVFKKKVRRKRVLKRNLVLL